MEKKHIHWPLLIFGLIVLATAIILMLKQTFSRDVPSAEIPATLTPLKPFSLTSSAFENDKAIPSLYSCKGANISPPLEIQNAPSNTKEYVLIMQDRSGEGNGQTHWLAWNIDPETTTIPENSSPEGAVLGTADAGKAGYTGPCPAVNTGNHTYIFELFALNDTIKLEPNTTRDGLKAAINGKVISTAQLTGTFESAKD